MQKFVRPGDRVGVAVSGGADSVALLLLLLELHENLGIVLSVVHFNHKLRGKASDADEKFVAKLAAKHGLEYHCASAEIAKKAKKERVNLEDAARRARYDYFRSLVDSGACTRIAVAHTADDQAETVLAHILRGTGLAGLGGIHPVTHSVFRPLLTIRRAELRAYLRPKKQPWREDATNRDTKRLRARIRMKLLPLLEKHFQPAIVEHLATLAGLAREDEAELQRHAELRVCAVAQQTVGGWRVPARDIASSQSASGNRPEIGDEYQGIKTDSTGVRKRMVRHIVAQLKTREGQLGAKHVNAVLELARSGQNGKSLSLPGGVEVRRERETLVFRTVQGARTSAARGASPEFSYNIDLSCNSQEVRVPELSCVFRLRVIDWPPMRAETNSREMVVDRERLRAPLVLRNWRPGDRLRPSGHQNARKLRRLLNEKHISRWEREVWPVLTSCEALVWARGFPVAAEFAADEKTRSGIVITEEQI
ncbi:MAG TPA: tRNA lysidine(34) synthetase TilS [Candidatus Dormibacteraeota bacterium]|nr:tRNA lysidine(34) synthetase TilS [Candidatus Dormibacteraeota bacterium]